MAWTPRHDEAPCSDPSSGPTAQPRAGSARNLILPQAASFPEAPRAGNGPRGLAVATGCAPSQAHYQLPCLLPDLDDTEHNGKLPVVVQREYISVSARRENKEGPSSMSTSTGTNCHTRRVLRQVGYHSGGRDARDWRACV